MSANKRDQTKRTRDRPLSEREANTEIDTEKKNTGGNHQKISTQHKFHRSLESLGSSEYQLSVITNPYHQRRGISARECGSPSSGDSRELGISEKLAWVSEIPVFRMVRVCIATSSVGLRLDEREVSSTNTRRLREG